MNDFALPTSFLLSPCNSLSLSDTAPLPNAIWFAERQISSTLQSFSLLTVVFYLSSAALGKEQHSVKQAKYLFCFLSNLFVECLGPDTRQSFFSFLNPKIFCSPPTLLATICSNLVHFLWLFAIFLKFILFH